jgi:hypothetical protein
MADKPIAHPTNKFTMGDAICQYSGMAQANHPSPPLETSAAGLVEGSVRGF